MKEHKTFRILLADDDDDDAFLFQEALEQIEIKTELQIAENGMELMKKLDQLTETPDFIFLDMNMPVKNGLECLKEIRSNPKFKEISIAIYSTSSSEKDIEETFIDGANIYIKKPNDFSKLKKVLKEVVNLNWQFHTSGLNKDTFFFSI